MKISPKVGIFDDLVVHRSHTAFDIVNDECDMRQGRVRGYHVKSAEVRSFGKSIPASGK